MCRRKQHGKFKNDGRKIPERAPRGRCLRGVLEEWEKLGSRSVLVRSEQNLDALLAAVQAIELQEAGEEIKRIAAGLRLPKVSA